MVYYTDMTKRIINVVTGWLPDAVVYGALLMTASGVGLLLEAIVDTMRYGAPR